MLEIDGLNKRYGNVAALTDMTFDVQPGELFGFVGSNGAGKTTTMRIIMGVLEADSGEVRRHGMPLDLEARRLVGYMPEERGLYPKMTIGEQLRYFARLHGISTARAREAVDTWMTRLGIAGRADDEVLTLSLGNQQRVQLASALVHDPEILVLDEPFSGLDPVAVDVMSTVLRERSTEKESPVLFSSHQLDLVERLCDRVGIVSAGHMVACGTVNELRDSAPTRIAVDVPDASDHWLDTLHNVTLHHRDGSRWIVDLPADIDDQWLLHRALATGPVREFAPVRPGLAELFRHVVDTTPNGTPSHTEASTDDNPTAGTPSEGAVPVESGSADDTSGATQSEGEEVSR